MRVRTIVAAAVAAVIATVAVAQPAPWYKWKSKLNGRETCLQYSPGDGWERSSGPYKDARCEKPGKPGS